MNSYRGCYTQTAPKFAYFPFRYWKAGVDYNPSHFKRVFNPRVDIIEDKEFIIFNFDLPGVLKQDVKVTIDDNRILSVKGTKKDNIEKDKFSNIRNERLFGEFTRSFELPDFIDTENISAKFDNGVLNLTLPKTEKTKQNDKTVEISSGVIKTPDVFFKINFIFNI